MREAMTVRALDREADERRERLNSTLDELASGLTPGRVLDEVLSYAKSGGGNFLMGLGKSAAANPLPTLLISTGCALFLSGRGGINLSLGKAHTTKGEAPTEWKRSVRGKPAESPGLVAGAADAVSSAATSVSNKIGSAAGAIASAASDVGARLTEGTVGAAAAVSEKTLAAGESVISAGSSARGYAEEMAEDARSRAASAQRKATLLGRELQGKAATAFEEYPLVVAAGGVILGAALAALMPRTRIEDRYMGDTSDTLKDAFLEGAGDKVDRVRAGVEKVIASVTDKAAEEDIVGAAKASVDQLADKVGKTLKAGKDAVEEEMAGSPR